VLCEEFHCLPHQIRGGGANGRTGLTELLRIAEYRGIARTVAYLDEVEAMEVKETPLVRLVRDLRSASYARIKADGIRRKREEARGG
jgi:hypothetical protein